MGLSSFQQYALDSKNLVDGRYGDTLASYANLSPEQVAAAMIDDGTGKYNFGSGDNYDAAAYQKAYQERLQKAQTPEGRMALGKADLDSQKTGVQGQYDFSLTHPGGYDGGDWMDHFMGNVFPAIVGAVFVGAGMGLGGTAAGAGEAGTVGAESGFGSGGLSGFGAGTTSIGEVAAPGAFDYAGLSNIVNGLPSAVSAGEVGTAGAGAAGLGGLGGGAGTSIPTITPEAANGVANSLSNFSPEVANVGSGGGLAGVGGGAADTGALQVPDEFINNAANAYDTQSNALSNLTAGDFSTGGAGGTNLRDIFNLGRGLTNIVGAVNDKNNANNTANNAAGQLAALTDAQKQAQAQQTAYVDQLKGLAADQTKNNRDQAWQIQDRINKIDTASNGYLGTMNGQIANNTANNAAYTNQLAGLSASQRLADNAYMKQLTSMYMPGTPEYNLMQQQMNAKDAASGRNSQYGTRAVDLAGLMAQQRGQLMTSNGYIGALNHTAANGLLTSPAYTDAMNNRSATDLLNSTPYQNALNQRPQTDLLTGQAYQNAINNTSAQQTLTSPAMANTVNNSSLLSLLGSPAWMQLQQQQTQAQNNSNNGWLAATTNLMTNGPSLVNSASNLYNSLFGGS